MFLKKLEIQGFKSFANRTVLEFDPERGFSSAEKNAQGITAIVGPNGSGKSNVADALRWVMGEQSMKNLRGKKSEDIIFAGSGKKARLGSAWVTLVFDNSQKRIPLEFAEVSVTRRIYRSGESEYLINGSRVRLIDIVDLLAKAGVGKESYCVINQGMSDAVLNASQADRRMILEDAAGVKQFQIQKERALKKLLNTKVNLERVYELSKEIEPHLKMLKRQAEKSAQRKEVESDLRQKQMKLYSFLWDNFQQERSGSFEEKEELGRRMMNIQREVDKMNDELKSESKEVQQSNNYEKLQEKRGLFFSEVNKLEKDLAIIEGRIEIIKERLQQQKIIKSIPVDRDYVKEHLGNIQKSQEKLIQRLETVETLDQLQDIREFARAIKQAMFDLFGDVEKGEAKVEENNEEKSKEEKEIADKIEAYQKEKQETQKKIQDFKVKISEIDAQIRQEMENDRKAREKFFELEGQFRTKQNELNILRDRFNDAKIRLARVEVREEDLTNEVQAELHMGVGELKYDGENIDRDKSEREITRLKFQMEQIGGIDSMVIQEYQETKDRFEFLTQESKDLEEAIESLKKIAKEMDQKIEKVFVGAFDQINKEFSKYFKIIFGGGNAKLIKTVKPRRIPLRDRGAGIKTEEQESDEEDDFEDKNEDGNEMKFEIGIDISACPPGKKINNLSMLSGGERSLTSIALLFAIISYNPPPFTVLDEIEAALDEANSRRFSRILQELSGSTQFIAITHNRETMRQASLLYGVTMGEDGISKILSVKLEQVGKGGEIKD
jgi:chromosome segregation protein